MGTIQVYKKDKSKSLNKKDLEILDNLLSFGGSINGTAKVEVYNRLFPEKIMTVSRQTKYSYFDKVFKKNREEALNYCDNFWKDKLQHLFLSKEKIMVEIMDVISLARRSEDYKTALAGYKELADLMGLKVLRGQIELNSTSLILHYHEPIVEPSPSNDVILTIKTDDNVNGN